MYTKIILWFQPSDTYYKAIFIHNLHNMHGKPLLKLKRSILLVMYSWLKGYYYEMNSKYSITLLFFDSN